MLPLKSSGLFQKAGAKAWLCWRVGFTNLTGCLQFVVAQLIARLSEFGVRCCSQLLALLFLKLDDVLNLAIQSVTKGV